MTSSPSQLRFARRAAVAALYALVDIEDARDLETAQAIARRTLAYIKVRSATVRPRRRAAAEVGGR